MGEIKLTYEEAMVELEAILDILEDEESTLQDSLDNFKKGITLYNYCSEILKSAEGQVKVLLGDDKDSLEEFNFLKEEENDYF